MEEKHKKNAFKLDGPLCVGGTPSNDSVSALGEALVFTSLPLLLYIADVSRNHLAAQEQRGPVPCTRSSGPTWQGLPQCLLQ